MQDILRVVIVDDAPQVRMRLAELIRDFGWAEVVGMAEDGSTGLSTIRALRPEVVLLDIRMPWADGVTVLRDLAEVEDRPEVVVLTNYAQWGYRDRCVALGARAVLDKTLEFAKLGQVLAEIRSERAQSQSAVTARAGGKP